MSRSVFDDFFKCIQCLEVIVILEYYYIVFSSERAWKLNVWDKRGKIASGLVFDDFFKCIQLLEVIIVTLEIVSPFLLNGR